MWVGIWLDPPHSQPYISFSHGQTCWIFVMHWRIPRRSFFQERSNFLKCRNDLQKWQRWKTATLGHFQKCLLLAPCAPEEEGVLSSSRVCLLLLLGRIPNDPMLCVPFGSFWLCHHTLWGTILSLIPHMVHTSPPKCTLDQWFWVEWRCTNYVGGEAFKTGNRCRSCTTFNI